MSLQVAKDRNAACTGGNAKLWAYRRISRTGSRRSYRGKDLVTSLKGRYISDSGCRNVLEPLTRLRIDHTEYRLAGGIRRSYIESVVSAVVPDLVTSTDLRNGVDEAP